MKTLLKEQVLTISQMKHLQQLGINTSKASMFYDLKYGGELDIVKYPDRLKNYIENGHGIGAFTLQDIISILPNFIESYVFGFNQDYHCQDSDGCYISYTSLHFPGEHLHCIDLSSGGLLAGCYEMLMWCAKNKYLKQNEPNGKKIYATRTNPGY